MTILFIYLFIYGIRFAWFLCCSFVRDAVRSNCTDGYLKIFLKGQETQDAYDKFDYELCGNDTPTYVVSDGPRLAMVFSSGEIQARGFKVNYTLLNVFKYASNTQL